MRRTLAAIGLGIGVAACQSLLDFTPTTTTAERGEAVDPASDAASVDVRDAHTIDAAISDLQRQRPSSALAVDDKNVYWIDGNGSAVYSAPKSLVLAQPQVVYNKTPLSTTAGLLVVGATAYFSTTTSCGHLVHAAANGSVSFGYVAAESNCGAVTSFAVAGTVAFAARKGGNQLEQIPNVESGAGAIKLPPPAGYGPLAAGNAYVYIAADKQIMAYPRLENDAGGSLTIADANSPCGIVLDGDTLYWVNKDASIAKSKAVPVTGDFAQTIRSPDSAPEHNATHMALSTDWIVWTDATQVLAIPNAGGDVHVVATDQKSPTAVAADATTVYWGTTDGFIRSAALP